MKTSEEQRLYMREYYRRWRNTPAGIEWRKKRKEYSRQWRAKNADSIKDSNRRYRKGKGKIPTSGCFRIDSTRVFEQRLGKLAEMGWSSYKRNGISVGRYTI